jgi:Polyketide cyclase / dehydrase and lipid transport
LRSSDGCPRHVDGFRLGFGVKRHDDIVDVAGRAMEEVGDFCGIATWHPAIEKCVLSADGKQRTLSVKGGGTIVEALEKWDDANRSYTYTILSGPLPVANYHSTISVGADPKGSALKWMGKYDAKGAPDAESKKTMDGVYEAGAKSLTGS